jgi:membrane fusion protein, macrolide-specific efflux system
MIKFNKNKIFLLAGLAVITAVAVFLIAVKKNPETDVMREIKPFVGSIQTTITSTAIVQPQNRLEIKPPINGRIDKIMVEEGDKVKDGQILAWMSSTERAALLDAAQARGPEEVRYWEEVYKPTPLMSPIDGEVIVSTVRPGQTVTSAEAVVVLSDRLIVQAQVDETDIGGVQVGQKASISLDAYPKIKIEGRVDHIYYESKLVNNVTIYQVDILPDTVPDVFRSGMSATVNIAEKTKEDALLIPLDAVRKAKDGNFVTLSRGNGKKPEEVKVELGISDEKNVEVISGISEADTILVKSRKYALQTAPTGGTNPLMPFRRGGGGGGGRQQQK